ncbi:transposase [Streptomyces sp. NPDC006692]|uniref:transposase n=1 Tax=Streptomyces sp. NPDC006692 TaxID=3364758 RepID=UPI00367898B0
MRRPDHLTDVERKGLDELCDQNPSLATTAEYTRRLACMVRDRRSEHLTLDVWIANVRLDGQRELRTLAIGMRRDRAAIQAALTATFTSGAVEGNVTRIKLLNVRPRQLRSPTTPHPALTMIKSPRPPN